MNQFITLIRRRGKDGAIGKWEILVAPDAAAGEHIDVYRPLSHQLVSDEMAEVRVCRLFDSQRPLLFPTKAEAKAKEEAEKAFQKQQGKTKDDGLKRQREQAKAEQEREAAQRRETVVRMNVYHDQIRGVKAT